MENPIAVNNPLFHDQPINIASEDCLNRASFATNIAKTVIQQTNEEGYTLSVEGAWGHGKSSVLNLVKEALVDELGKDKAPVLIDFNPWLIGNCEQLTRQLLGKISSALGMVDNSKEALKAAKQLKAYATLFDAMSLVPVLQPFSSVIAKVFKTVGKTSEDIAKLKERDLEANKEEINKTLAKLDRPVVIFIDDLDRVTPKEAFEVLRLVKAVADFKNVTYILAFDPNYLSQVLKNNHIANSHEYLDKLVQLRLSLPAVSDFEKWNLLQADINQLELEKHWFDSSDQNYFHHYLQRYFNLLIKTPRDRKRVLNHFAFSLKQLSGNVAVCDLFALSVLVIKADPVYQQMKAQPSLYSGVTHSGRAVTSILSTEGSAEANKEIRFGALSLCDPADRVILPKLLRDLFPMIERNQSGSSNTRDSEGRVSSYRRLYLALHGTLPTYYVAEKQVNEFIEGTVERKQFVTEVIESNGFHRLLELLKQKPEAVGRFEEPVLTSLISTSLELLPASPFGRAVNNHFENLDVVGQLAGLVSQCIANQGATSLLFSLLANEKLLPVMMEVWFSSKDLINQQQADEKQKLELQLAAACINCLQKRLYPMQGYEQDIFSRLVDYDSGRAKSFLLELKQQDNFLQRLGEIFAAWTNSDSEGMQVRVKNDWKLFKILSQKELAGHINNTDLSNLSAPVQAALKSIADNQKYCLKTAELVAS